jgi:hypothetical protein
MQRRSLLVAVFLCAAAASARADQAASVRLPIAARAQSAAAPDAGWCGETALQEALLHYGAFVPQQVINRAGRPSHPDLYWGDLPRAMKALGLRYRAWSGRGGLAAFLAWSTEQFRAGRPVLAGVKLYPTDHPEWGLDHIVLLTGIDGEGLLINTTWGHALRRSRAELASTRGGMSLRNRARRQHAYVIDGRPDAGALRLAIDSETAGAIEATVHATGLDPGRRYRLSRAAASGGDARWTHEFAARSDSVSIAVRLRADRAAYFRIDEIAAR